MCIAHLKADKDAPHKLLDHLTKVAKTAASNAEPFGGAKLAYLAGLWHDIGKYNPDCQKYLREVSANPEDAHLEQKKSRGPNHSSAGALHVLQWLRKHQPEKTADKLARILAYPIMGHHAGLADFDDILENVKSCIDHQKLLLV